MSIAPEDIQPSFDSNARKYRCCFGCCWHVRVCAKIIGSLECVCITIAFVASLIGYIHYRLAKGRPPPPPPKKDSHEILWKGNETKANESVDFITANPDLLFAIYAFFFVLVWIVVILLFYGINNIRPRCLLPHLFVEASSILYTLVMVIVYALQHGKWSVLTFPARPAVIIYGMGCVLEICFFINIIRCYHYLKAKRRAWPISRLEKDHPGFHLSPSAPMEEGGGAPV